MADEAWVSLFSVPPRPEKELKLFQTHGNRERDAIMSGDGHWFRWDVYCCGYRQAADVLVDRFLEKRDGKHSDYSAVYDSQAYAIIFLYRHYLELRLKELFVAHRRLLGESDDAPTVHGLVKLWNEIRDMSDRASTEHVPEIDADLEVLQGIIEQFDRIDRSSEAFRYPTLKNGKSVTLPNIQVDLHELKQAMGWVSFILDGWSTGIDDYIKAKHQEGDMEM